MQRYVYTRFLKWLIRALQIEIDSKMVPWMTLGAAVGSGKIVIDFFEEMVDIKATKTIARKLHLAKQS